MATRIQNNDELPTLVYRVGVLEGDAKQLTVRMSGIELWKAKVEDNLSEKARLPSEVSTGLNKDLVKIVILGLTVVSGLIAFLTQVLPRLN